MPVERRIREGTERNAAVLDPDVERFLGSVVRRSRRRVVVRRALAAAITVPALIVAIVAGPRLLEANRGAGRPTPATQPTPTVATMPPITSPFAGTVFTRTVADGLAVVQANGIAGRWTIVTDARGRMRILAPRSFAGAAASRPFELNGDQLRTDAFSDGICAGLPAGTYGWTRVTRYLVLTPISDLCDARVWVLTRSPWTRRS
jgi:hypothetical protein